MGDTLITVGESILMMFSGVFLLRMAGRKSISQMTLAQTVVMISIGSIIIQPIVETSIVRTIIAASTFVLLLILIEWLQTKFDLVESLISGKAKTVIENGQPVVKNMRSMRMTVDKLEMRLRQQGIHNITDVKTATLEPNGQLGYELERNARPLTVGEFEQMIGQLITLPPVQPPGYSIFNETKEGSYHSQPDELK